MEINTLKKNPTDIYVEKTRHSSFIRTNLEDVLQGLGVTSLILTGAFVDGCVGLTAIDGFERDFDVVLARDAVMESDAEAAASMLMFLHNEFQIENLSSAEIISRVQENKLWVVF